MAEGEQPGSPRARRSSTARPSQTGRTLLQRSVSNWELADASAIKALQQGCATPEQQKRALDWILKGACALPEWAYTDGNPDETNINLGRQFVGHQIMKLLRADLSKVPRREPKADEHSE